MFLSIGLNKLATAENFASSKLPTPQVSGV